MKSARIDFNSIKEDGTLLVSPRATSSRLTEGDVVICSDPDEPELSYLSFVTNVDANGMAILKIDWDSRVNTTPSPGVIRREIFEIASQEVSLSKLINLSSNSYTVFQARLGHKSNSSAIVSGVSA